MLEFSGYTANELSILQKKNGILKFFHPQCLSSLGKLQFSYQFWKWKRDPLSIPSPEYASIPWKFFNFPINFKNKMESSKSSIPRVLLKKSGCTGTSLSILQINMEPSKYYIPRVCSSSLGILQLSCQILQIKMESSKFSIPRVFWSSLNLAINFARKRNSLNIQS